MLLLIMKTIQVFERDIIWTFLFFAAANIFLTAEGNCLKLGDFGSAVKIKAHTTVPGELQGFVGTQGMLVYFHAHNLSVQSVSIIIISPLSVIIKIFNYHFYLTLLFQIISLLNKKSFHVSYL